MCALYKSSTKLNISDNYPVDIKPVKTNCSSYHIYNGVYGANFMKMNAFNGGVVDFCLCLCNSGEDLNTQIKNCFFKFA